MAYTKEKLTKAGDYNLATAEILSYKIAGGPPGSQVPFRIDIQNIIISIELQQSIFNRTMIGKIQVYDTKDVRTLTPIVGLERLNLAFHTPGLAGFCNVANEGHPFHIYKIESVAPNRSGVAGAQAYDIYFCSREAYFSTFRKVSKAYTGQVEVGVEDIFKNRKYLSSRKNLYVEPTRLPTRVVIPNLRPFEAIDMMAKRAVSGKYENAGYLFYETREGYHFRSIESLLAIAGSIARPAKWTYNYGVKGFRHHTGGKEIVKDMKIVEKWSLTRPVDVLNNIDGGAYASKLIEHDMFNKTINTTEYDYAEDFGNHFHTEHQRGYKTDKKLPLPNAKFDDTFKTISQEYDQKVMLKSSTSNIHDTVEAGQTYTIDPISNRHTLQKALSQRKLLTCGILEFTAPGNSILQAGDIITFDMPLLEPLGHNKKLNSNPYWAGRYLIYDMKHSINRTKDRYSIEVRAVKDNPAFQFMPEHNSWTHSAPRPEVHNLYERDNELLARMSPTGDDIEGTPF
jgi:hypothetical protein